MKKNCIILKNIVINENLEKNDILKIYLKGKITKQSKNDKSYSYSFEPIEIKVLNKYFDDLIYGLKQKRIYQRCP